MPNPARAAALLASGDWRAAKTELEPALADALIAFFATSVDPAALRSTPG